MRVDQLIYNKNKSGPRIEPCGTPHVILLSFEMKPFTSDFCERSLKYDSSSWNALPVIPNSNSFSIVKFHGLPCQKLSLDQ